MKHLTFGPPIGANIAGMSSAIARQQRIMSAAAEAGRTPAVQPKDLVASGLLKAFKTFVVPGKPERFLAYADPSRTDRSSLRAVHIVRKLADKAAYTVVLERTVDETIGLTDSLAPELMATMRELLRMGDPTDMLCMYSTDRGDNPDPDDRLSLGWVWLTKDFRVKHLRKVHGRDLAAV